jgi:hypothetical protein
LMGCAPRMRQVFNALYPGNFCLFSLLFIFRVKGSSLFWQTESKILCSQQILQIYEYAGGAAVSRRYYQSRRHPLTTAPEQFPPSPAARSNPHP